jgi:tRNA (guanine26-N2/guanine27-N2)-dimethyltransferase
MRAAARLLPPLGSQAMSSASAIDIVPFLRGRSAVPAGLSTLTEGGAQVLFSPGEVFYNPVQVLNRDLSVLALRTWDTRRNAACSAREVARALGARGVRVDAAAGAPAPAMPPLRIMEALSATGLRSIRYATELPPGRVGLIVANDLEPTAAAAIRRNVAFNGVGAVVAPNAGDASLVMHLAARGLPLLPDMASWMGPGVGAAGATTTGGGAPAAEGGGGGPRAFLFDVVDLDPYGAPSPFLDAALGAVADGGLLAVTCTDMAVLAGNHMDACRVKYGSLPVRARHFGEQALRIVLAAVEAAANKHRKSITPLIAVCVDFYVRVYVGVRASSGEANAAAAKLANLHQCTGCDAFWLWPLGRDGRARDEARGLAWPPCAGGDGVGAPRGEECGGAPGGGGCGGGGGGGKKRSREAAAAGGGAPPHVVANHAPDLPAACPHCGRPIAVGGPLWRGAIHDSAFVRDLEAAAVAAFGEDGRGGAGAAPGGPFPAFYALSGAHAGERHAADGGTNSVATTAASRRRLLGLLHALAEELPHAPLYYDVATLTARLKIPRLPLADLFAAVENAGYEASGAHACPTALKTNAPPAVLWAILRAVKAAAAAPAPGGGGGGGDEPKPEPEPAPPPSPPLEHATFVPPHIRALARLPVAEALASPLSLRPTPLEMPRGEDAVSTEWPAALRARLEERREAKGRGGGQRFMQNPGAHWGPRARATGAAAAAAPRGEDGQGTGGAEGKVTE